jgi:hypothetical protein
VPIVTTINGDAASLRGAARWVGAATTAMQTHGVERADAVRKESERAWQDDAAEQFRRRLTMGSAAVEDLCSTAARLREALMTYADSLTIAKEHMATARRLALDAGLMVTEHEIFEPGPAVVETPRGSIDHTIGGNYEKMVAGFEQAKIEAGIAESVLYSAWAFVRATWHGMVDGEKKLLSAGAFVTGWTDDLAKRSTAALSGTARAYREAAAHARASYNRILSQPTVDERLYKELALEQKAMGEAAVYEQRVTKALRFGRVVKISGWAVVLAGVGYDIYKGKPVTKAVFTSALSVGGTEFGMLAARGLGRLVVGRVVTIGATAALATSTAPEAAVVGVGILAGGLAAVGGEMLYDELFPSIEEQQRAGDVVVVDDPHTVTWREPQAEQT